MARAPVTLAMRDSNIATEFTVVQRSLVRKGVNKIDKRKLKIKFTSSLSNLTEKNKSFDSGVLQIAYAGLNRNNTSISKDVFDKCKHTLHNCPVVANYDYYEEKIGGHDVDLVKNNSGNLKIINVTYPVGCIPESANIYWEDVDNGTDIREYLTSDVLLWKRQPCYEYIKEHGIVAHSMEIDVNDGEMIDGVYVIRDFTFTALCLLGKGFEPCFDSSLLRTFNLENFEDDYRAMMQEVKEPFILNQADESVNDKINTQKEDKNMEQEKLDLLREFSLSIKDLDFKIEEFELEKLREKFQAIADTSKQEKPLKNSEEFTLNVMEQIDEISNILGEEKFTDSWGYECTRFCLVDIQDDEVITIDCKKNYNLYGIPFKVNGDAITLDFTKKKRKKCKYEDFNEGTSDRLLQSKVFDTVKEKSQAKYEEAQGKLISATVDLEDLKSKFEIVQNDLHTLREETNKKYALERKANIDELLGKFDAKLSGNEEFEAVKKKAYDFEVDALEKECFAIIGSKEFSIGKTDKKDPLSKHYFDFSKNREDKPYGGLYEKYGR